MWILYKSETDETFILLPGKPSFSVGRAGCDLILKDDLCISRSHAVFHIADAKKLEIEDLGSKYGTFHNDGIAANKKITPKERIVVHDGDVLRFGVLKNKWQVKQMQIFTMASALTRVQAQQLEKYITDLHGKIIDSWSTNCTHLTMCDASVTVKLLHALLEQLPIVNCNYWAALLKAARRGGIIDKMPKVEDYQPNTPSTIDLSKRAERRTLFAGKTFVFMNRKHFEMYSQIVMRAGGQCKDLNSGVKKTLLTRPNVIVLQYVPSTQSQTTETLNTISGILAEQGLRCIPEYEIGLAIIHCSTEEYCNPSYKPSMTIESEESTNASTPSTIFENTETSQNVKQNPIGTTDVLVPETEGNNSAPKLPVVTIEIDDDEDDYNMNVAPMPKITVTESIQIESQNKRKRRQRLSSSEDEDENLFDFKKAHVSPVKTKATRRTSPRKTARSTANVEDTTASNSINEAAPSTRNTRNSVKNQKTTEILIEKEKPRTTKGFLEKTQVNATVIESEKKTVAEVAAAPVTRKLIVSDNTTKGFLEKTLINSKNTESEKNTIAGVAAAPVQRKRTYIAVLGESDDDEDDLFNFGPSSSTQNSKKSKLGHKAAEDKDNSDNELFDFGKTTSKPGDSEDDVETQPYVPSNNSKSKFVMPKPIPLPSKIDVSGWLSCPKLDIKTEKSELDATDGGNADVKQEAEHDETKKWLDSLKGCIEVKMFELNLSSRSTTHHNQTNESSISSNGGVNFKTFVKKKSLCPQQRIIKTIPYQG